jgi:hypothetical protein
MWGVNGGSLGIVGSLLDPKSPNSVRPESGTSWQVMAGLWDAGRLAQCGGVQAVSGFEAPADGSPRLVLGIAIVLVSCLPMWALLLWMATSSVLWRWKAEKSWKTFLAPVAGFAVIIGGLYAWTEASFLVVSRSHRAESEVLVWVWIAQMLLAGIAVPLVAWARDHAGVATAPSAHRNLRRGRALVLAWGRSRWSSRRSGRDR